MKTIKQAILILDMPKSCDECVIRMSGEPNEWCWALKHGLDDIESKPFWCPLIPLSDELRKYMLCTMTKTDTLMLKH